MGPNSPERLTFSVRGLPAPAVIEQAVLTFSSYDADHPGSEGRILVNGQGPFELPAREAWDNMAGDGTVDVGDIAILGASWTGPGPGAGPNTWDQADFTADGWTDIGDFAVIGSNWSPGAGSSGGAEGVALNPSSRTVPAPPALILGSALLCGLALTRPR